MTTGGIGNPILSIIEDVFAFANALVAIFLPWVVLVVIVLVVIFLVGLQRRLRRTA